MSQLTSRPWIIALNGSKGAGKSTLSSALQERMPGLTPVSLDEERRALDVEGTLAEKNKIAFENAETKIAEAVMVGGSVVLDCGLSEQRVSALKDLANDFGAELYLVFLHAPYEEMLRRVSQRDAVKGKEFNKARFDEVYKPVEGKDYDVFNVFDTSEHAVDKIADDIMEKIQ